MKTSKKGIIWIALSLVVVLASFTVMLLDALLPLNIWVHPILTLLLCLFAGFGVLSLVKGIINKSPWFFMLSSIMLGLALLYVLINVISMWWIGLIAVIILWVVVALFSFMTAGNKTEEIALNKDPEYKDYKTRKAEKEEAEKNAEEEPLPEIKSFKD